MTNKLAEEIMAAKPIKKGTKFWETNPSVPDPNLPVKKQMRGFACMTPERRQEIARKGGASVPSHLRSFSQNNELASSAGRKGGAAKKVESSS